LQAIVGKRNVLRVPLPADLFDHLGETASTRIVIGHFFYPAVRLTGGAPVATVVRDPVERAISVWEYLNWQTSHPDHSSLAELGINSIDDLIGTRSGHIVDLQTRLLGIEYDLEGIVEALAAGEIDRDEARRRAVEAEAAPADRAMLERAMERMRTMVAVGVTEALPMFARRIERHLGLGKGSTLAPENTTPARTVADREEAYGAETRRALSEINPLDAELHSFARELAAEDLA
jgi:hypothetical protein